MQKVDLLSSPSEPLKLIYTAARTCYSADSTVEIFKNADYCQKAIEANEIGFCWANCNENDIDDCQKEKMQKLVLKTIESGHHSVLEHAYFVFAISGVSRACTHQKVRHRHMSFSQKSQRYVTETGQFEYVVPESIRKSNPVLFEKYKTHMQRTSHLYQSFIEADIPPEDARFVLPNAAATSMVASLNLRELIHFANLRLCTNAQWEIRELTNKMCDLVVEKEPWLKPYLAPKCERLGYCDEIRSCGRKNKKAEVVG